MNKQDAEFDADYAARSKAEAAADYDPSIPMHLQHSRKANEWAFVGTLIVLSLFWYLISSFSTCATCAQ